MKSIVIFGGAGFVGKHLIRRLAKQEYQIIVPYQKPTTEAKLRLLGDIGQIVPFYYKDLNDPRIDLILHRADVCINLKTHWDSKKRSFNQTIFQFNKKLLEILNINKSLKQFIYFSGLGVDEDGRSLRSIAIYKSEKLIFSELKNSIIIRPGIIIGVGDKFLSRLIPLFKMSFLIPLFGKGFSRFQPVFIDDISLIVEKIITDNIEGNHIFELVGQNILTYRELYELISQYMGKKRYFIPIPMIIARFMVRIIEITPFSLINVEQLSLFEKDNLKKSVDKDFDYLKIIPQDILGILRKIAKNY